ncbi:MAG TPA: dephospho-CoA kinase [Candidatus Ventricola intestinavium]|nr:dephospho-CoA kinase [Candidatus Ventricola intestinavium]
MEANRMKIGLTGSIACGKSTVSAYLRELGYAVVDADALSHALTSPGGAALPALRSAFGDAVFDGEALNRRRLGQLVFADAAMRERLNALLHPMICREIISRLRALDTEGGLVFGDIPLLYECGLDAHVDRVWVVCASPQAQLSRLMARDGLTRAQAQQRIAAQMPLEEKARRADACITTDISLSDTRRQVLALLRSTCERRQP